MPATSRCSACAGRTHESELRQRLGIQLQETQLTDKLTVEETLRLFRSSTRRAATSTLLVDWWG